MRSNMSMMSSRGSRLIGAMAFKFAQTSNRSRSRAACFARISSIRRSNAARADRELDIGVCASTDCMLKVRVSTTCVTIIKPFSYMIPAWVSFLSQRSGSLGYVDRQENMDKSRRPELPARSNLSAKFAMIRALAQLLINTHYVCLT